MDTNQPITSSPDQHPDPNNPVDQSPVDDVTFGFNHLQLDSNNNGSNPIQESSETEDEDDDEDDDDDDNGDFTFACVADNDSPAADVIEHGQIRKAFPLFDQSLLSSGDYDVVNRRLPIDVPVDKVFIESPPSKYGETDGTVRAVPKDSEINMKSNSTGFSKLWRFRNDEMNRSNSDGRDAFVFLESPDTATTSDGKQNAVNVGKGKGVSKGVKGKKSTSSAHEVYLRQKGGQTEEERRRSYLPYRPGLMGFFTNVNGGLSKNVHPF